MQTPHLPGTLPSLPPAGAARWSGRVLAGLTYLYLAGVVAVSLLLRRSENDWWGATLLLYGPRWVGTLPLVLLIPAAVRLRRRLLWPLGVALILVVGPVLGFCLPWRTVATGGARGPRLRVLSCNVDFEHLDPGALARLVAESNPDIVALQEWSAAHQPVVFSFRDSWQIVSDGGLCLASRFPIRKVEPLALGHKGTTNVGGRNAVIRCDLDTPHGVIPFFNLQLATPRPGLAAVLAHGWRGLPELRLSTRARRDESAAARRWADQVEGPRLFAGDFNLPPESSIYRDFWSPLPDAFATAGLGFGMTKYEAWFGARIDHILADPPWRFVRCWVGPDVGSDHRPVLADLEWLGPPG